MSVCRKVHVHANYRRSLQSASNQSNHREVFTAARSLGLIILANTQLPTLANQSRNADFFPGNHACHESHGLSSRFVCLRPELIICSTVGDPL